MKLRIELIKDVRIPERAHPTDAGLDFFVPNKLYVRDFQKFIDTSGNRPEFELNYNLFNYGDPIDAIEILSITVKPHESILIPSGVRMIVPENFSLIFFNKSGMSVKKHVVNGAQVIDPAYRGEVHLHLINTSNKSIIIKPGDKVSQGILIPIVTCDVELADIDLFGQTSRGIGGFGSTGN